MEASRLFGNSKNIVNMWEKSPYHLEQRESGMLCLLMVIMCCDFTLNIWTLKRPSRDKNFALCSQPGRAQREGTVEARSHTIARQQPHGLSPEEVKFIYLFTLFERDHVQFKTYVTIWCTVPDYSLKLTHCNIKLHKKTQHTQDTHYKATDNSTSPVSVWQIKTKW